MKKVFLIFILLSCISFVYGGQKENIARKIETILDSIDPALPIIEPLFEYSLSDISICKGPNHSYYLTGTSGDRYGVQDGIRVWVSKDLKSWNQIGNNGMVWTFDDDGKSWQKEINKTNGWKQRGIIAPKIYYLKDSFFITYSTSNSNQSGILKSTTERPEGPYADISSEEPLVKGIYSSLFMDSDSSIYFIWGNGQYSKMKDDMSGMTSTTGFLSDINGRPIGNHGITLSKIDEEYIISGSRWSDWTTGGKMTLSDNDHSQTVDSRYDCILSSSKNLAGSYSAPYLSIPHGGGSTIFEDFEGKIWGTIFGNDETSSPIFECPAIVQLELDPAGRFKPVHPNAFFPADTTKIVYVSREGNNSNGSSWENAYTSLQRAIDNTPDKSQFWISKGTYDSSVRIDLREAIYIFGGFVGNEKSLAERNIDANPVILNGRKNEKHVLSITTSKYIRIDGLTIKGGNASSGSSNQQYGAGIHILGGGETVRVVNCTIEENYADQDGAGLYASLGAAPVVINCMFRNNTAKNNGGAAAIYCNSTNGYLTRFYNCTMNNNAAYGNGGAVYFDTNLKRTGLLKMVNCIVSNNNTLQQSGNIALDRGANLQLINSTICFNKGTSNAAVISRLGRTPSQSRIVNCIFYRNTGGTMFNIEGEASVNLQKIWTRFQNCIFYENDVNSLVVRNFDHKEWKTVNDLNNSVMGDRLEASNPDFIDPLNGNFHLKSTSRAINRGTSYLSFEIDIDGNPRNLRQDSGSIDIGADEAN
jgi:xylan 1,4-beta-xylosidase